MRRAGWALVQTDKFGRMQAAAFGYVPANLCPFQSSKDAEDYAVCMTTLCCIEPFELVLLALCAYPPYEK